MTAWSDDRAPYFLHDAFEFRQLGLSGHSVLLAIDRRADRTRLAAARDTLDRLREFAGQPVIYVTDALASYERRRLIGWKKCADGVIVKLVIPEDSKRSHAFGRKCRAEFAEVLEIIGSNEARSHTSDFPAVIYRVGKTVRPANGWSEDWREECAPGIHFFITRAEAEAY